MPAGRQVDVDDRAAAWRPFALHPVEPVVDVEDQVVAAALDDGPQHDDAEFDRPRGDRRLGYRALERGVRHARCYADPGVRRPDAAGTPR
jgi:hypothetical protein